MNDQRCLKHFKTTAMIAARSTGSGRIAARIDAVEVTAARAAKVMVLTLLSQA